MIQGSEGPVTVGSGHDPSADTIELELTREQQRALSEAACTGTLPDKSGSVPRVIEYENFAFGRTARIDTVCNVTFAVAVLAIALASLWPAADRPAAAVTTVAHLPVVAPIPAPAVSTEPQGTPVQIRNAFDPREVFEFPPGTPETEARQAVAELLLARARDRHAEQLTLRRVATRLPERGPDGQAPEVFVTRLLAGTKDP
jgi:hypothetical protein